MTEILSAAQARQTINEAKTSASVEEWETIASKITKAIDRNSDSLYLDGISKPVQDKLRQLGYRIESSPDPRDGGGYYVKW